MKLLLSMLFFIGIILYVKEIPKNEQNNFTTKENKLKIDSLFSNYLIKNSDENYTYYLPDDNKLHIMLTNITKNNIKYVKFDGNKLTMKVDDLNESIIELESKYELIPSKGILEITYSDVTKKATQKNINIVYLYDVNSTKIKNTFEKHWEGTQVPDACKMTEQGIVLGGSYSKDNNINIDYEKTFNKDVSIAFYFKRISGTTVDMQISVGERLYVKFNNSRIEFMRNELINPLTIKKYKVHYTKYSRFKRNQLYKVIFTRKSNLYTINIFDALSNKLLIQTQYIDDGKKELKEERYKNLKIGVGKDKMKILISKVEIY